MSETTEILFNSPALHSLRREQLQKLCKLHSLKANGKNTELIDRLKYHALTLPKDDPLSIAARSEEGSIFARQLDPALDTLQSDSDHQEPRPSDQWEIVMESIQELEETNSSQGTLSSQRSVGRTHSSGEFEADNSKATILSSPIKAFARSFGINRANSSSNSMHSSKASVEEKEDQSMDELTQHSIPYSATRQATPPLNDNFTFDPTTAPHIRMSFASNGEPLPGCTLRPGEPAPPDARLSLGLGRNAPTTSIEQQPTTTIRLVSKSTSDSISKPESLKDIFQTPKLKAFATDFDILMSPSAQGGTTGGDAAFWAPDARPSEFKNIYPTLTIDDLPPDVPPSPIKTGYDKGATDTTRLTSNPNKDTLLGATGSTSTNTMISDPFVFGSPLPQHSVSNTQFRTAAASVLEEMNKRLIDSGIEGVGMDLISKLQPGAHNKQTDSREMKPLPSRIVSTGKAEITKKFDDIHKAEFGKMEGIDAAVKRRAARRSTDNNKASGLQVVAGKKRKSNVLGELGDGNGMPRRPMTKSTSLGTEFGSGGGEGRSESTRVISNGRRNDVLPGAFGGDEDEEGEERGGKRARVDPDPTGDDENGNAKDRENEKTEDKDENAMDVDNEDHEAEEEQRRKSRQLDREREVIKRKLEISRAKRRSSVGGAVAAATRSATVAATRKSKLSGVAPPVTPKPKTSRFGFLASAKKLVTSVWNRGKPAPMPSGSRASSKPTNTPAPLTRLDAPTKSSLLKRKGSNPVPAEPSAVTGTATANNQPTVVQTQEMKANTGTTRSKSPFPLTFGKSTTTNSRTPSVRTSSIATSKTAHTSGSSSGEGVSSIGTKPSATANTAIGSMGTKSHARVRSGSNSTSRLFAPTASSLAKTRKTDATFGSSAATTTPSTLRNAAAHTKTPSLLGSITNSPNVQAVSKRDHLLSPPSSQMTFGSASKKIFSKPVSMNGGSGIPILASSKKTSENGEKDVDAGAENDDTAKPTIVRRRTFTRKPRISRSKVIAKLASQRAAAFSPSSSSSRGLVNPPATPLSRASAAATLGTGTTPKTPRGLGGKRTRSSIGARHGQSSFTGAGALSPKMLKERSVLASAKKRVRQSEYARRRSRISGFGGNE